MRSTRVVVRLDRDSRGDEVLGRLSAAGLDVDRVLDRLGVVSGSVPLDRLAALGAVPGVAAVERDGRVRSA